MSTSGFGVWSGSNLSKGKNQHFVPRHYLRRFSFDGGKRIRLFNLASNRCVANAPLKTQCSADYFYSKDPRIESQICELEGAAESHFSEIYDSRDIAPAKHDDLLIILLMMKGRTRQSAESINLMYEAVAKEIFRKKTRLEGKDLPKYFDRLRIREESAALRAFRHNVLAYPVILDLALGRPDRRALKLDRAEDCELINTLQIMNAEQNICFRDEGEAEIVRKLLFKFSVQRKAVQKSDQPKVISHDGMAPSFIMMPTAVVPVPGIWSFCKVRGLATPRSFGSRNPEWCAIYEQYVKATAIDPKPFDTWMEEQRIKRTYLG